VTKLELYLLKKPLEISTFVGYMDVNKGVTSCIAIVQLSVQADSHACLRG